MLRIARSKLHDLFDDFPYNAADRKEMLKKYESNYNVSIPDFESLNLFRDDSIDILHIDIANNGDTYEYNNMFYFHEKVLWFWKEIRKEEKSSGAKI